MGNYTSTQEFQLGSVSKFKVTLSYLPDWSEVPEIKISFNQDFSSAGEIIRRDNVDYSGPIDAKALYLKVAEIADYFNQVKTDLRAQVVEDYPELDAEI